MSSLPLTLDPDTPPKPPIREAELTPRRTGEAAQHRSADPKHTSQAQPTSTVRVAATAGQRRWTVVVPRRLTDRAAQALADAEASQSALPPAPEAIRFRAQITMFGLIATVASGLYVYTEKHAAASLDRAIAHAYQTTAAAHQNTNLLRAEWALLNNPDRLHPLADRYLSLQPLRAAQFAKVADLHSRLPKILYGPPIPPSDDDVAPPIVTRRLLAMAEAPAPQEPPVAETVDAPAPPPAAEIPQHQSDLLAAEPPEQPAAQQQPDQPNDHPLDTPEQPARTPIVPGPSHAYRVLAHAGAVPALVDTDSQPHDLLRDDGQSGLVETETPKPAPEARPYHQPTSPPARQAPRAPQPAYAQYQPARPAQPAWPQYQPRQPSSIYTQYAASHLLAHAEPKPRPIREPTPLRPELVHMLMAPHSFTNPVWAARPPQPQAAKPILPEHHTEYGRSDPPHFLSAPQPTPQPTRQAAPPKPPEQQQYAEARPRLIERQDVYTPPITYRAPPAYAYRPYYNGYYGNPYGGYYAPRPVYPNYQ